MGKGVETTITFDNVELDFIASVRGKIDVARSHHGHMLSTIQHVSDIGKLDREILNLYTVNIYIFVNWDI